MMRTMTLVAVLLVLAGCGKAPLLKSPADTAARGEKAVETIQGDADRAAALIVSARTGAADAGEAVRAAARVAEAVPAARPWAGSLARAAVTLESQVVPQLDEAQVRVRNVVATSDDLVPLVMTVSDLVDERDRWQKEAAREKERADSAVSRWLLLAAAGGFAGILAGAALFVWLSRKTGLVVGLASLAVFAVSVALYRWLEWFAWGGLALIVLAVAALGYGLYRNRQAFATLVQGGQDFKGAVAEGVQYTTDEIRRLFNAAHATAQADAGGGVEKMVQDVKGGQ
jgi:predicted small lipoprotein YifL